MTDDFSYPDFEILQTSFDAFDGMFACMDREYTLEAGDRTATVRAEVVTGRYFEVLKLTSAHGRLMFCLLTTLFRHSR